MSRRGLFSVHLNHLPMDAELDELVALFSEAGDVRDKYLCTDPPVQRYTYAFIRYATQRECDEAIALFDGWEYRGNSIRVSMARDQPNKTRTSDFDDEKPFTDRFHDQQGRGTRGRQGRGARRGTSPDNRKLNQERVRMLRRELQQLDLTSCMPLLMRELERTPYTLGDVDLYPPAKFHIDTGPIDALVQEKLMEEKTDMGDNQGYNENTRGGNGRDGAVRAKHMLEDIEKEFDFATENPEFTVTDRFAAARIDSDRAFDVTHGDSRTSNAFHSDTAFTTQPIADRHMSHAKQGSNGFRNNGFSSDDQFRDSEPSRGSFGQDMSSLLGDKQCMDHHVSHSPRGQYDDKLVGDRTELQREIDNAVGLIKEGRINHLEKGPNLGTPTRNDLGTSIGSDVSADNSGDFGTQNGVKPTTSSPGFSPKPLIAMGRGKALLDGQ